jgi:hypothetical protein
MYLSILRCYSELGVQNCLYFTIFAKGLFGLTKKTERAFAFSGAGPAPKGGRQLPDQDFYSVEL